MEYQGLESIAHYTTFYTKVARSSDSNTALIVYKNQQVSVFTPYIPCALPPPFSISGPRCRVGYSQKQAESVLSTIRWSYHHTFSRIWPESTAKNAENRSCHRFQVTIDVPCVAPDKLHLGFCNAPQPYSGHVTHGVPTSEISCPRLPRTTGSAVQAFACTKKGRSRSTKSRLKEGS